MLNRTQEERSTQTGRLDTPIAGWFKNIIGHGPKSRLYVIPALLGGLTESMTNVKVSSGVDLGDTFGGKPRFFSTAYVAKSYQSNVNQTSTTMKGDTN